MRHGRFDLARVGRVRYLSARKALVEQFERAARDTDWRTSRVCREYRCERVVEVRVRRILSSRIASLDQFRQGQCPMSWHKYLMCNYCAAASCGHSARIPIIQSLQLAAANNAAMRHPGDTVVHENRIQHRPITSVATRVVSPA